MKRIYLTPEAEIIAMNVESSACITASAAENEAFNPIPGLWD